MNNPNPMTAASESGRVVAYGLWHAAHKRMGNFVHNEIENARYEAERAASYGYELMSLVPESLLAEAERRVVAYCSLADSAMVQRDALQAQVDAVTSDDAVLRACAAHKGHGGMVSLWTTDEIESMRAAIRAALGET